MLDCLPVGLVCAIRYCLRVMTSAIVLYDRVNVPGVFARGSVVNTRRCLRVLYRAQGTDLPTHRSPSSSSHHEPRQWLACCYHPMLIPRTWGDGCVFRWSGVVSGAAAAELDQVLDPALQGRQHAHLRLLLPRRLTPTPPQPGRQGGRCWHREGREAPRGRREGLCMYPWVARLVREAATTSTSR